MKKSLLAVAALTAFAGAAQAQSSVTVYGLLDSGWIGGNEQINGGKSGQKKQTGNAFGANAESTSRLGFKGTEDLGGGRSAFFTVEVALTPNGDQNYSTSASANRQTFVGLKQNGIGWGAFGTQYTNIHNQVVMTDPGAANNVGGNVIYATTTLPQSSIGSGVNGNVDAYTLRVGNTLFLASDTFAGFQGNVAYTLNASSATETQNTPTGTGYTGGAVNKTGVQLGLNYTLSKFYITGNWQTFKQTNPWTATTAQVAVGGVGAAVGAPVLIGAGNAAQAGSNDKTNQGYIAATYDFGILKSYAQWVTRKDSSAINSLAYVKRQAWQIGVRSFITPTIEGWASYGNGKFTYFGGSTSASVNGWQAGLNYFLSKRTNLYAIYGGTNTATSAYTNLSYSSQNYALGVRHTF